MLNNALVHKGELFHLRCSAHILNLVVQDGLKEIDISVDKIRECVKYVKGSQGRMDRFGKSISQTSLDSKRSLAQDVPTRWNSTFKMLSSALYYRRAFEHLQLADTKFTCCPIPDEWAKVKKICEFLEFFYDATNAFSGTLYPTANLYFSRVYNIQMKLKEACLSSDAYMQQIGQSMMEKFDKYWGEFNTLLAIAVVFDPRYKFTFLEFSYKKLYGPGSIELAKIKDTLFSLFDEYISSSPPVTSGSSSCSQDSESRKSQCGSESISNFMMVIPCL